MRVALVAGLVLVSALLVQPGTGLQSPLSLREENRQSLQAEDGIAYDPQSLVTVVTGPLDDLETLTVTKETALEMELDFLDEHGIRLLDLAGPSAPTAASENPQPAWPALGTFVARELGWSSMGATCPAEVADAPEAVVTLYNQLRGTSAVGLGVYESSVSEHWQKRDAAGNVVGEYGSSLQHTDLNGNTAPTYRYGRDAPVAKEGWTLRFAFEADEAPGSAVFCTRETLEENGIDRTRLTGKFFPFADRIDD
jgi:hypothetical protein